MVGINDRTIVDALQALAQAMSNNNRVEVAPNWLEQFQRNHPPTFKGGYDPDAAMNWLMEIEKIFNAIECPLAQKVRLATFMLTVDAHFWVEGALQRMIDGEKEVEFLELKQGNDIVVVYAAKFDALVRYCTHYHGEGGERAKCIKFVNGLRLEVKTVVNYQEIYHYPTLVNKSRIYDRDNRAHAAFYKGVGGPMRASNSGASGRSKPYYALAKFQGNHARSRSVARNSFVSGAASVGGFVSTPIS
ncbi:uncharacterized protein LOC109790163 [Cajanus cajan]|uniref:uncharacterized protein LOC109790163 n=1 Tax=Cajanus cajan TaxID=3821 RepID=UPI00098D99B1|nr:uncharacterized protein LOC109790163 [Cajanus cajan]